MFVGGSLISGLVVEGLESLLEYHWVYLVAGLVGGVLVANVGTALWLRSQLRSLRQLVREMGGEIPLRSQFRWGLGELHDLVEQCRRASHQQSQRIAQVCAQELDCRRVLKQSHNLLEMAMEAAQMEIWQCSLAGPSQPSPSAQQSLPGWSSPRRPAVAKIVNQSVYAEDLPQLEAAVAEALRDKTSFEAKYRVETPLGLRWQLVKGKVFQGEAGQTCQLVGITSDITQSKHLDLALQASEKRLADVLDNALGSLVQLRLYGDNTWAYEFWSSGAEAVFGYRAEEFLANQDLWLSRVLPEDGAIIHQAAEQLRASGSAYKQYRFRRPDGTLRWIASWSKARWDNQRGCWLVTITDIDISDHKRLEAALRDSQIQLQEILDSSQACIAQFRRYSDQRLEYDLWSAGAELVFGYRPEELMADPQLWMSRIPKEDYLREILPATRAGNLGQTVRKVYRFRHKDGSLRWISSICASRWDEAKNCWLVTAVDQDISEQKYLELALQESQGRLSDVLDNTLACIVQFCLNLQTSSWNYQFWSAGAEAVFGFTPAEFMADQSLWFSRIPQADIDTVIQESWDKISRGLPYRIEYRFRHKDGTLRWIASIATSRWSEIDNSWIVTVVDTDISDRKALAAALQTSQKQLSDILDRVRAAICTFRIRSDHSWEYEYFSAGHQRVFGFTPAELKSTPQLWLSRVDPSHRQHRLAALMEAMLAGREHQVELRFQHKNGSWRWIAQHYTSRWDENHGCWSAIAISQDVTDRKRAEEELRRFERVVAATQDGVALIDTQYQYRIANPTYLDAYGKTWAEVVGKSVVEVIGEQTFQAILPDLERCLAGETVQVELWYDYPAAGRRYVRATYSPCRSSSGDVWGIAGSFHNLTELKLAEEALRQNESRFRALAANLPGVIYQYVRCDDGDEFTYMSPGSLELCGLDPADIMANPCLIWRAIHPDDAESLHQSMGASAQTLIPWQWEGRIVHASGSVKWMRGIARPEKRQDGSTVWDGLLIDISDRKQAETLLHAERNLLTEVMNTSVAAVTVLDPKGQIIYANEYAETVLGLSHSQLTGRTYDDPAWQATAVDGGAWPPEAQPFHQVMTTGEAVRDIRHAIEWPDRQRRILAINGAPVKNDQGQITKLVFTIEDITQRLADEMSLRRSEERYRLVAENMSDLVCLHQPDGTYLYVTPSCQSLLGYAPEDLVGRNPRDFFHPEDCDRIFADSYALNSAGIVAPITYRMRHKAGHYIWLETLSKPILDAQGQVKQLQTNSRNVSEKVQIQSQLEYDAIHDSLTGLPNRSLLMERLDLALERFHRSSQFGFAVLFLDLDRFKVINDSLGHHVGDDLLVATARLLSSQLRTTDLAARLGGDEFIILLEDITDSREVTLVAQRILASLRRPFALRNREVFVSTSIGIALAADHYQSAAEILRDADIAMYQAKADGKGRYTIFDPVMHLQVLREMHMENALRRAIANQELQLHYQPIVRLQDGQLQGFEGLIRWQHSDHGLMSPAEFIPLAEETGLIVSLGTWILSQACQHLSQWQQRFPTAQPLKVNVNLSARQLKEPEFATRLERILRETNLSPGSLDLEVTESVLIEDVELILANLNAIRSQGVGLSIDDFGTGYSSLSYLHRFPFTCIKIDRAFISNLTLNPDSAGIVSSILALSKSLNLEVVAEGVETHQQVSLLRQLECTLAQGYYFSPPLTAEKAANLLQQGRLIFQ